jgi:hypothetical protein
MLAGVKFPDKVKVTERVKGQRPDEVKSIVFHVEGVGVKLTTSTQEIHFYVIMQNANVVHLQV